MVLKYSGDCYVSTSAFIDLLKLEFSKASIKNGLATSSQFPAY